MADDNETHEEVCAEMRSFGDVPPPRFAWRDLAERAEAAHKRELAAKEAELARLKACLAGDCERMRLCAEPCANCHIERVNERNALIKGLADALKEIDDVCDGDMCKFFAATKHCTKCKYLDGCSTGIAHSVLKKHESEIAKVREVVNG